VFRTQGSANPALAIQALASRLADRLARGLVDLDAPSARHVVPARRS
jgi:hypothetical protein